MIEHEKNTTGSAYYWERKEKIIARLGGGVKQLGAVSAWLTQNLRPLSFLASRRVGKQEAPFTAFKLLIESLSAMDRREVSDMRSYLAWLRLQLAQLPPRSVQKANSPDQTGIVKEMQVRLHKLSSRHRVALEAHMLHNRTIGEAAALAGIDAQDLSEVIRTFRKQFTASQTQHRSEGLAHLV